MDLKLTHINDQGRAKMVDVSEKADTQRIGVASGRIRMQKNTFELITGGKIKKGDVLSVAQVAGVMAAKKTWELIPMCHPLLLTGVDIHFELYPEVSEIEAVASVKTTGKTGIEMEALHAVSVALLTIYDMCKAVDRGMQIVDIFLLEKDGGKSGHYVREREY
ncbi:Molybdenum cofactor biosynthesis protein C [uncultured Roseburia sp.]|uniref:Cyclic pyranopterin monophosphate synthase n=1 Tax=Brotonthovivens ammoniilytica TaxID=2981725 RepID=A0ABT2TEW1_9FIRM|nr:cyclic pyranopterin monophosphate synthase MoaC [Brotonthovivens ammoniilytica]MCU6760720.1 cyclic pyranopterin monophosphate synthase MoaC [Brotonthovivens ammoniilytica]SCI06993.1 Molybdenum cofactor biosynthesis protein C [uncultured Roseburia sp.]